MNFNRLRLVVAVLFIVSVLPATAAVRFGSPFGEHMVLPQGVPVPIWGTGAPGGDTVRISFDGQSVTTSSDWEGRWLVVLAPMKPGGPYQMLVQIGGKGPIVASSAANDRGGAELNDVVVGEVRVVHAVERATASGTGKDALASPVPHSAWIRIYRTPAGNPNDLQPPPNGQWWVASRDPAPVGSSTASYSLAQALYDKLHIPIGVIEVDP